MPNQRVSLFNALHALTSEIQTEKTAAAKGRPKQADNPVPADPGGYNGASSHPTAHVDNRGQAATEGSRSSENESDVEADIPDNVNTAPDAKDGQSDDVNTNIGMQQSATGEDPSVEDDYKAGKDDPGSSSPARTDNSSLDGMKYASHSISQLHDLSSQFANGILADLANGQGNRLTKQALANAAAQRTPNNEGNLAPGATGANRTTPVQQQAGQAPGTKQAGAKPAAQQPAPAAQPSTLSQMIEKAAAAVRTGNVAADSPVANNADLAAGYDLATRLGVEKSAAQHGVAEIIESTINDARTDADLFGSFYNTYRQKHASGGGGSDGEDHSKPGDDTSGSNGAEGNGGETGGDGGGDSSGGDSGAGGGGGSLGDMLGGGADPGALMGGGGGDGLADPSGGGGAGGPPPGGGAGGAGGGVSVQDALMQLASALDELGIPIQALANAPGGGMASGGAGGPPGGGPPGGDLGGMMGGPPPGGGAGGPPGMPPGGGAGGPPGMPPGGDPMSEGMKLASAVVGFKRQGKYQFKSANAGTPERALRDRMKSHVLELLGSR